MSLEELKSDYKNMGQEKSESLEGLKKMQNTRKHPVLKKIKRHLIVESIIWGLILIVFYDFFDGHLKSIFWNVLLTLSIVLLLVHNLLGYSVVKKPIQGVNLKNSLKNYSLKIKKYSRLSIISRVIAVSIFFLYLTSNIVWTGQKLWTSIGMFVILISLQIYFLLKIWNKRARTLKNHGKLFFE